MTNIDHLTLEQLQTAAAPIERLSVNCHFESDLAHIYWNDFQSETEITRIKDWVWIIGDCSVPFFKITNLKKMTKAALAEKYDELVNGPAYGRELSKDRLIQELRDFSLKDMVEHDWHSFLTYNDYFETRGYSQGDLVKVHFAPSVSKSDREIIEARLGNLLWDTPVHARIEIDDHTIHLDEALTSEYDWDVDKARAYAKSQLEGLGYEPDLITHIMNLIPEHLEHK